MKEIFVDKEPGFLYYPRNTQEEHVYRIAGRAAALPALFLLGLIVLCPDLSFSAEPQAAPASYPPRWGLMTRGGHYGVPGWVLDMLFEEHPGVDGTMFGGEIRYYGDGGPSGAFSMALTFDIGESEGFGLWQENADDTPIVGGGGIDIASSALTLYFDIAASFPLHPYVGFGLGIGYVKGRYVRDEEEVRVEEYVPVVHVPVGMVLNLGSHLGISVEGRFIDGIFWGGSLQARF